MDSWSPGAGEGGGCRVTARGYRAASGGDDAFPTETVVTAAQVCEDTKTTIYVKEASCLLCEPDLSSPAEKGKTGLPELEGKMGTGHRAEASLSTPPPPPLPSLCSTTWETEAQFPLVHQRQSQDEIPGLWTSPRISMPPCPVLGVQR